MCARSKVTDGDVERINTEQRTSSNKLRLFWLLTRTVVCAADTVSSFSMWILLEVGFNGYTSHQGFTYSCRGRIQGFAFSRVNVTKFHYAKWHTRLSTFYADFLNNIAKHFTQFYRLSLETLHWKLTINVSVAY